jgi:hypothetical protein
MNRQNGFRFSRDGSHHLFRIYISGLPIDINARLVWLPDEQITFAVAQKVKSGVVITSSPGLPIPSVSSANSRSGSTRVKSDGMLATDVIAGRAPQASGIAVQR